MGVCLVHEKAGNRLYIFNHVEYDSTSLADEYFRDVDAGVPIKMPHNYFPHNDPATPRRTAGAATPTCCSATGSTISTRRPPMIWKRSARTAEACSSLWT
jgi:hypothetical protein